MTATPTRPAPTPPALWRPGTAISALLGIVAVALTMGLAELLAAVGQYFNLLGSAASPLNSLGGAFIDLTPQWLKQYAVDTFGTNDKLALRTSMVLVLIVLAAGVGVLARWRRSWALGVVVVLVAVTLVAVYTRTGASAVDGLPVVIGAVAGGWLLLRSFAPASAPGAGAATDEAGADREPVAWAGSRPLVRSAAVGPQRSAPDRRGFFRLAGLAGAAAVVAGVVARWIPNSAQVQASRAKVAVSTALTKVKIPAGADLNVNGLSPFVTPNANFYRIDTALTPPRLRAEDWKLRVHGLVDKEINLDFAALQARPQQEHILTLTCVSNDVGGGLIGNASWIGARIDDLLAEAGPQAGADCVLCTSIDGFTSSTPLQALTDGRDALLATAMNGEPLPIEHGFPVRMVVPGLYGYVSATKWVIDMQVTKFSEVSAYWTDRGWSEKGPVKTSSRIDVPGDKSQFDAGHQVTIAGVAWAQHRGIDKVEVQIDNGPWQPATLSEALNKDTWRQWKLVWTATSGAHTIRCRATDGTGALQVATEQGVIPDGATGYDVRKLTVR